MRLPRFAFWAFAAAVVAACSPISNAPSGLPDSTTPVVSNAARRLGHSVGCGLPNQPLPGHYFALRADGNFSGDWFTGNGVWEYGVVSPSAEPPTSDPSPPPTDVYVYSGHYTLTKPNLSGCAYLVKTKDGRPFYGSVNGMFDGSPPFEQKNYAMKASKGGRLTTHIHVNLDRGTGKVVLTDGAAPIGTLVLDKKQSGADFIAAMQPRFTFSCDPKNFIYKTLQAAKPATARGFGFNVSLPAAQYVPRYSFCGQENSYLAASEAMTNSQTYAFSHGAIDYRLSTTFSSSVDWANRPDVVVWEEAYRADGSRDDRFDLFLALVRVR
jgi:hypothetical protein